MLNASIDVICPLYNAEPFVEKLNNSLVRQKDVNIKQIVYILTESNDNSEDILQKINANYYVIPKNKFSHSLTREKSAFASKADIICFVTQDIVVKDSYWLKNLITPIASGIADAAYSRQISKFNNIEKYTRENNYPEKSHIKTKEDIPNLGLNTFFFSDAAGAIKTSTFKKLKGYDAKNLPINEDMYFAYKIIMDGGKIAYQAESVVYHSHNFSLKELYKRYVLIGKFMHQNPFLDKYGTNSSGGKMAKYILKRIIQDKNFKILARYPFDMAARFIGMKVGKRIRA